MSFDVTLAQKVDGLPKYLTREWKTSLKQGYGGGYGPCGASQNCWC